MVSELESRWGGLDVLINNAGIQYTSTIDATLEPARVEAEIAVNLTAPMLLTAALQPWLARGAAPLVVNISSGLALAPKDSAPAYCATKAGLSHMSPEQFASAVAAALERRPARLFVGLARPLSWLVRWAPWFGPRLLRDCATKL